MKGSVAAAMGWGAAGTDWVAAAAAAAAGSGTLPARAQQPQRHNRTPQKTQSAAPR